MKDDVKLVENWVEGLKSYNEMKKNKSNIADLNQQKNAA